MTEPIVADLEERPRKRSLLVLGYIIAVAVFVLGTSFEWATGIAGLFWASVIRGIYIWIRRRRGADKAFMSPWLFVIAGLLAAVTLAGKRLADEDATSARAAERGIVATPDDATPADRCATKVLDQADSMTAAQRATIPAGLSLSAYARQFCDQAAALGALTTNGDVIQNDKLLLTTCVDGLMASLDALPQEERRFSATDFRKFSNRYCAEAIDRDLLEGARDGRHKGELEQLQQAIIADLLATGEITELP